MGMRKILENGKKDKLAERMIISWLNEEEYEDAVRR